VQHQRLLLVVALASTSVLALGACVGDTGNGAPDTDAVAEPESIGDAEEADTDPNAKITVTLPYRDGKFTLKGPFNSPRFVTTVQSSITIGATASWSSPGICRGEYTIQMVNAVTGKEEGSGKNYATNGRKDLQSFQNLPPGKHYFTAYVRNPANGPRCVVNVTYDIAPTSSL
jgi:hypothetical protein